MTPSWHETYALFAELSVALIGFAVIVGIFSRRVTFNRGSDAYFRLQWLLQYSVPALGASLLPIVVVGWAGSDALTFRISAAIWVSAGILYVAIAWSQTARVQIQNKVLVGLFGVGDFLLASSLVLMALSIIEPTANTYTICVSWSLLGSIVGFLYLMALLWEGEPGE